MNVGWIVQGVECGTVVSRPQEGKTVSNGSAIEESLEGVDKNKQTKKQAKNRFKKIADR